jgi:cysteine dioxygenase
MAPRLDALVAKLEALDGPASLEELKEMLGESGVDIDDARPFLIFRDAGYTRNLVRAGPWFNLLVLCWRNGQRSPIHDHTGSSCGMLILKGVAAETTFLLAENGHAWPTGTHFHHPGSIAATQDADIHQVSNLQDNGADLVTLHIYSPPLLWMGTYSLMDSERGQEPMFLEFSEAAGI